MGSIGPGKKRKDMVVLLTRHEDSPWQEWRPGVRTRVWSGAVTGATGASGGEQFFAPGTSAPWHWHYYEEHVTFYGPVAIHVGDESVEIEEPCTVVNPPTVPHSFTNIGDTELHVIGFHSHPISETLMVDDPTGTMTISWEMGSDFGRRRLIESGVAL